MGTPGGEVALEEQAVGARWKARALIASFLIAMLALYWPTTLSLFHLWLDTDKTTYTHGFIVLAIALWLIVRDERLDGLQMQQSSLLALALYFSCSVGWLVAYRAGIETAHELAFPVLAWLAVYAAFGSRVARLCTFPIAFLFFSIPVWDALTPHLQTLSAAMVGHMLHLSGISAYVDGSLVHIGVGTFEIAGGCSGLHFVMVGLALGALYGELGRDSIKTRALLLGIAFFLALAANWLRVYVIVVAGDLTNMQHYLVRVEHYRFGWIVFAVMMALFFWIASRFPPAGDSATESRSQTALRSYNSRDLYVVLGLLLVPGWSVIDFGRTAAPPALRELRPQNLADWRGPFQVADQQWNPVFVGADARSLASYEARDGQRVALYVAAYRDQRQDKELIGYHNRLTDEPDIVVDSSAALDGAREMVVGNGENRDLVRFSYWIGNFETSSGFTAQLAYGVKSLWSAPLSRVVAFRIHCESDCDTAHRTLDAFRSALQPHLAR
jgi:exosortase A